MADTAVPTIGEIITNLGGTPTAQTIVPALEELRDAIGSGLVDPSVVEEVLAGHPEWTTTVQDNSVTGRKLAIPYWDWVTDENGDQRLAIVINE